MNKKARIIAYYLPQFHPIPENDEWWGKGFTEWTNVGKAKPLFRGHYQPRVPADLGYYDLRVPEVREQQAEMAREAGIEGFCYWHYWFGNGKRLLERPFNEVLASGKPDFPFCLGWANESWEAKIWNTDGSKNKTLIEQKYLGSKDNEQHFYKLLPAFKDKRYIRVNDCPFFLIYKPFLFNKISEFIQEWNYLINKHQVAEKFYFVANIFYESDYKKIKDMGFDAVTVSPSYRMGYTERYKVKNILYAIARKIIYPKIFNRPFMMNYSSIVNSLFNKEFDMNEDVIPFIFPNWDHSPRSGKSTTVLHNSTPELFRTHVKTVVNGVSKKTNKLIILKSWNEWGEGNYVEPDLKYGKGYLDAIKQEIIE
jgi:hypothetical protein